YEFGWLKIPRCGRDRSGPRRPRRATAFFSDRPFVSSRAAARDETKGHCRCSGNFLLLAVVAPKLEGAEEAMLFVINPRGEVEGGLGAAGAAVAEDQGPQSLDHPGVALVVPEQAEEVAGTRIKGTDAAVAETAHQQGVAEFAESVRRQRQAPGRVQ